MVDTGNISTALLSKLYVRLSRQWHVLQDMKDYVEYGSYQALVITNAELKLQDEMIALSERVFELTNEELPDV